MILSVIIPVYNEEQHILNVLKSLDEVNFPSVITDIEYVIIDDCSSDNTARVIENFSGSKRNLVKVKNEVNRGKGYSVRYGIEKSKGDIIIIQDSDLELIPSDIPLMIETMFRLKCDFINGSRYMPGIIRPLYAYKRYYANKLFTKLASILINVRFTDLACGYKLFSRELYNKINLTEDRFGFEAELLIKAARIKKTSIAEVPVNYFPRNIGEGKKIRNLDGLRILLVILRYGLF